MIDLFLFIMIGLFMFLIYMVFQAFRNHVSKHELFFEDLPEAFHGYRIFFISDIHFRIVNKKIINEINKETDIIIIGGDLLEKKVPISNVVKNIKLLTNIAPTYFVWGNNDYEGNVAQLTALLKKHGVEILDNRAITLRKNRESISLIGVDNGKKRMDLSKALAEAKEPFKIFVSHTPEVRHKLPREIGIRLFLSGHTHGGQIRLFGFGIREKGMLQQDGNRWVLISNGYGTTFLPLRFGAKAETHLITLKIKGKNMTNV